MNAYLYSILLLVPVAFVPSTAVAQPGDAPAENAGGNLADARALYRKAEAAYASGKTDEAKKLFSRAFSLQASADAALGLGQTEMDLKLYRDAAEHLDFAVRNFPLFAADKVLQGAKAMLAEAKTRVATIQIIVEPEGAEVRVDGQKIGTSPLEVPTFVEPGKHGIDASLGSLTSTETTAVEAGKEYTVALTIKTQQQSSGLGANSNPVAAPIGQDASSKPPLAQTANADDQRSIVPVIIGGAVFAVAVGSAIGFKLDENAKSDKADSLAKPLGISGCTNPSLHPDECRQLRDAATTTDHDRKWFVGSVMVAAAAAVATPLYWFWPRSAKQQSSENTSIRLQSGVTPQGASVLVTGQF